MKHGHIYSVFIFCLVILAGILIFFRNAHFDFVQQIISPLQKTVVGIGKGRSSSVTERLRRENSELKVKLAQQDLLVKENQALRDQLDASAIMDQRPAIKLLPAAIVAMPTFIPGITTPSMIIVDKGSDDGVYIGQPIIDRNNLIGQIIKRSKKFSLIQLIIQGDTSFIARDASTNAIGVLKGRGDHMELDNVVLSDNIKTGDMVTTNGETQLNGSGIPPGLVVGQITSVEKNPSALFQKASIKSLVDMTKLTMVFLMMR